MAAQKLTRSRLIQILVMLIILISAFVWRTLDYPTKGDESTNHSTDHISTSLDESSANKTSTELSDPNQKSCQNDPHCEMN